MKVDKTRKKEKGEEEMEDTRGEKNVGGRNEDERKRGGNYKTV